MQLPLQITFRGLARSDTLDALIRERAGRLEKFHPHLVSCRVVIDLAGRHQHQGKHFNVRVAVKVPGGEVAVDRQHDEDPHVAVRDAFDAARRKLEDSLREMRGDVKRHVLERSGAVLRLDLVEGFGFIGAPDGTEYYFSRDNVVSPRFEDLAPGTEVHFIEEPAAEGWQAKRVSAVKKRRSAGAASPS